MGNADNKHELTRVALREEVEKSLDEVLPSNLPAEAKQTALSRVEQIVERYSSPYPDPVFLKKIEEVVPGSAQEVLNASLSNMRHRQEMERGDQAIQNRQIDLVRDVTSSEVKSTNQGRWLGFSAYIACLLFAGAAAYLRYDFLAIGGFLTAAAGVVIQIIRGSKSAVNVSTDVGIATTVPQSENSRPSKQSKPSNRNNKRRK